jgi:uncharacterized membrane protein YfcA
MAVISFSAGHVVLLAVAAFAAGAVNAAAGGGSLISFPALLLVGAGALSANVTNTVALCPGYLGGVIGYRAELEGQAPRLRRLGAITVVGAVIGAALLSISSTATFRHVVPFLLILACGLLLAQQPLSRAVERRRARRDEERDDLGVPVRLATLGATIYGAYFGAAMGIMVLAVFGVLITDTLQRLNALKAFVALTVNVVAAVLFAIFAPVNWTAVVIMAPTSLAGGRAGAALARRIPAPALRLGVAALGLAVAVDLLA